jgi:hypothetical protein
MVDYLTHYYSRDTEPFRSLSALSENEALKIMKTLCDGRKCTSVLKMPITQKKGITITVSIS